MFRKIDDKAQANNLLLMMVFLMMIFFIMPTFGPILGYYFGLVLEPLIGFHGKYPVLTLFLAGIIVVTLSSTLTNFFTDWKKMGETQETQKAFSKEMQKARKEGNTNRVNKLMKMQPELFKKQQEASSGMFKPMVFLIIFIWPIFMWLRQDFLFNLDHYYFTLPWANNISFFYNPFLMQSWLWIYLIASMVIGQVVRQGLKYFTWSNFWEKTRKKIMPFRN